MLGLLPPILFEGVYDEVDPVVCMVDVPHDLLTADSAHFW